MEATVTELVIDAYGSPSPEFSYDPVGPWKEMSEKALTARPSPPGLPMGPISREKELGPKK